MDKDLKDLAKFHSELRKKRPVMSKDAYSDLEPELKAITQKYPQLFFDSNERPIDFSLPVGWASLLDELLAGMAEAGGLEEIKILQIKEKFGGLRFYISGANAEQNALIEVSEEKSFSLCVECGALGERMKVDWLVTVLCPKHSPKQG